MRKLILFLAVITLAACSKSEGQKVPPGNDPQAVGPFTVDFSKSASYAHSFKVPINQSEGGVDYLIQLSTEEYVEITKADVIVTGCPATQVTHKIFWKADSKVNQGYYLNAGSIFKNRAGVEGTLMHILYGLSGCTHVEVQTLLTKK